MPWGLVVTKGWNSLAGLPARARTRVGDGDHHHGAVGRCSGDNSSRRGNPSMASIALRIRLSITCWIWTRSTSTRSLDGSSRKVTRTPFSLTPTSARAPASSTSLARLSSRFSVSPRATKSRRRRMIWPARKRLLGRLVHGVADHAGGVVGLCLEQAARAHHVVGDCGQRLVEFMRQRRGHLAHRAEARDMDELGLQLLQPRLGLLPLGKVADKAGEEAPSPDESSRRRRARSGRSSRPCARRRRRGRCR